MNREILFRGKATQGGFWITGDLQQDRDLDKAYISEYYYYHNEEGRQREWFCDEVDPETVGQYTGYTDMWESQKFEDDIFECDDERYIIAWDEEDAKFVAQGVFSSDVLDLGEFPPNEIRVIGNIHDNPELGGE